MSLLHLSGQIPVGEPGPEGVRRGISGEIEAGVKWGDGEKDRDLRFPGREREKVERTHRIFL